MYIPATPMFRLDSTFSVMNSKYETQQIKSFFPILEVEIVFV